jgi:predicted nuclease of restriction endonuclease-like (RecB) superfamily
MIRFAELFADGEIVSTLSRQLSWSHSVEILQLRDPLQRDFYAEMCRMERWRVRTLRARIGGMLFERTALSKKPEILVKRELAKLRGEDTLSPDLVFRDPYFLDFLGLKDAYSEKDLETAICARWSNSFLNSGQVSASSPARSASSSTARIFTSTCCSTTANFGNWSPSI